MPERVALWRDSLPSGWDTVRGNGGHRLSFLCRRVLRRNLLDIARVCGRRQANGVSPRRPPRGPPRRLRTSHPRRARAANVGKRAQIQASLHVAGGYNQPTEKMETFRSIYFQIRQGFPLNLPTSTV